MIVNKLRFKEGENSWNLRKLLLISYDKEFSVIHAVNVTLCWLLIDDGTCHVSLSGTFDVEVFVSLLRFGNLILKIL